MASWSVWALLAALAAVVNWVAVAMGRPAVERWAKPLTMVGLIAAVLALGATGSRTGWLLLAALVCCLLGDVALLADTQARFLLGLSAFPPGQLLYAVTFSSYWPHRRGVVAAHRCAHRVGGLRRGSGDPARGLAFWGSEHDHPGRGRRVRSA